MAPGLWPLCAQAGPRAGVCPFVQKCGVSGSLLARAPGTVVRVCPASKPRRRGVGAKAACVWAQATPRLCGRVPCTRAVTCHSQRPPDPERRTWSALLSPVLLSWSVASAVKRSLPAIALGSCSLVRCPVPCRVVCPLLTCCGDSLRGSCAPFLLVGLCC